MTQRTVGRFAIVASLAMLLSACGTQSASHPSDQLSSREVIFVTNALDQSVNVYPIGSRGDSSPTGTIKGPATGLDDPVSIALDSSGKIYVLNNGTAGKSESVASLNPSQSLHPAAEATSHQSPASRDPPPGCTRSTKSRWTQPDRFM
jgi:hypothetical protein